MKDCHVLQQAFVSGETYEKKEYRVPQQVTRCSVELISLIRQGESSWTKMEEGMGTSVGQVWILPLMFPHHQGSDLLEP